MTSTVLLRSVLVCVGLSLMMPRPVLAQGGATAGPVTRARALELFRANCAVCHGPDGAGAPLTKELAFKNRKWKHGSRVQDVVATITYGVPTTQMQSFKGRLTPAEINALAALVRSFDKTLKPAGENH